MYLTIDTENYGLFGEAFAVGFVLTTDAGVRLLSGMHACPLHDAKPDPDETTRDFDDLHTLLKNEPLFVDE